MNTLWTVNIIWPTFVWLIFVSPVYYMLPWNYVSIGHSRSIYVERMLKFILLLFFASYSVALGLYDETSLDVVFKRLNDLEATVASQKQEIMEAKHREHLLVERLNTVELKVSKYDSWSNNDNNNEYQTENVVKSVEPSNDVISEHINQTTESNKMINYHQNLNRKLKHEKFSKGL